jgi:AraC-like DNA-binding protein
LTANTAVPSGCGFEANVHMPSSAQHRSNAKYDAHINPCGVSIHPSGYAFPALDISSVLGDYVDEMVDWDIARPDQAQALTIKLIPHTGPFLLFHYRTPFTSTWQFGSRACSQPDYRHFATNLQSGVVVLRPRGPLGMIGVRLRPEAATALLGEHMQYFLDTPIGLDDLFGTSRVSLLAEVLAEARTSAERFACIKRFLVANLRERVKSVACRAAALLRQNPHLRVRHLAARLDVSERHLSRSFQAMFGMRPKQFARIARIERVWLARSRGTGWADIAYAARFTDQAHMINDFTEIVGVPPAQLVRPPGCLTASRREHVPSNLSRWNTTPSVV